MEDILDEKGAAMDASPSFTICAFSSSSKSFISFAICLSIGVSGRPGVGFRRFTIGLPPTLRLVTDDAEGCKNRHISL